MFQRLIAIVQEEYMQLTRVQQVRQLVTQQLYNLERQYNEQERIHDPYNRMMLQSETLDEMKELKERMRQDIGSSTPKPYKKRAQALFQSMEPFLKFNERGEILSASNQLIPQSRLEDLVQHAVRDRRRNITPTGWQDFRHLLKQHNVPKFTLNRDTLEEMERDSAVKREDSPSSTSLMRKSIKKEIKENTSPFKKKVIKRLKMEPAIQKSKRVNKDNPKYEKKFGFLQGF